MRCAPDETPAGHDRAAWSPWMRTGRLGSSASGPGRDQCQPAAAPVERWVVGEDGCVQALQWLAGVDAELAGEQVADAPVGGERLGLPAAAVQRQHELAVQPLPQRMLAGQLFQLAGERVVPAQRQVGVDPRLQRGQPQLLQPGRLGPGERVVGQIGQHRATPPA
jgi:hypothetical protein